MPKSVGGRLGLFQPARLADSDRKVRHRSVAPGAVPVLLAWIGGYRIVLPDSLRSLASGLHPTLTFQYVEQLSARMGVPMVSGAGLKTNDRGKDGRGLACGLG